MTTGELPAVTLVDGSDPTLLSAAAGTVLDELLEGEDRSLSLEDYSGEEVDLAAVADACATPPFLTSRRVVVVRDIGRWNTDDVAPLLAYLEEPLPTTALVLVADGGQVPPKLAAAAKAKGRVVPTTINSRKSGDWVREQLRDSPLGFDGGAVAAISDHLGEDVARLVPLVELLVGVFGEGARVGAADVAPYLGTAGSVAPWDLTDGIDNGDAGAALLALRRLLEGGERHPLVVLAILARHVQSLLRVDSPAIRTEGQAAEAMGIAKGRSTFPAKKALRSAQQWGSANIAEGLALVAQAELDLKGASAWPGEAVLEVLVGRLCRLARSARAGGSARRAHAAAASARGGAHR